jgi:hypothetical protein
MTRDDIIKMAREAGAMFDHMTWVERDLAPVFERFAELVTAKEREACAKVCDNRITNEAGMQREDYENRQCAAAIRARGEQ